MAFFSLRSTPRSADRPATGQDIVLAMVFAIVFAIGPAASTADEGVAARSADVVDGSNASPDAGGGNAAVREWNFRVLLDDREIGYHDFLLEKTAGSRRLRSDVRFDVKFLFFTAYSYHQTLTEEWDGLCLESIRADTHANGEDISLVGLQDEDSFDVKLGDEIAELPPCVMTFAYWEPKILEQSRLLNPQTGSYLTIDVESVAQDMLVVRGEATVADRYRLTAKDMQIDLWYSKDNEWVALESLAKGGRIIRYELI